MKTEKAKGGVSQETIRGIEDDAQNKLRLPEEILIGPLDDAGGRVSLFPLGRRRDDFQFASVGELFLELFVHLLLQLY